MPATDRKLRMDELGRPAAAELARQARVPVRLVLDDIRSRHNVGSIFRTADAFRLDGLDLCGFTPVPPHREIEKTALGATASVPWMQHATAVDAVLGLKQAGWSVWAVEQTLEAEGFDQVAVPSGRPIALVLGNELHGVSEAVIGVCEGALVIPQYGVKHSLNVSVCAGIVAWWFAGRRAPVSQVLERP